MRSRPRPRSPASVRVDRGDEIELAKAYGLAHRGYGIPNEVDTRFATASGTKGLTALAVVSLIEEGLLELDDDRTLGARRRPAADRRRASPSSTCSRTARGSATTSTRRSSYDLNDYVMPVPVHELATTEDYLAVLDGHPTKFAPDERFGYCNGGYVVLALIAERASGSPFHELVRERVCEPAGMDDTAFLRSDELPGRTALGYLDLDGASRTQRLPPARARHRRRRHLHDRGGPRAGSGGAFFAGRIVSASWVGEMVRPRSDVPDERCATASASGCTSRPTRSCWSAATPACPSTASTTRHGLTYTVLSNTTGGAWPIARFSSDTVRA